MNSIQWTAAILTGTLPVLSIRLPRLNEYQARVRRQSIYVVRLKDE